MKSGFQGFCFFPFVLAVLLTHGCSIDRSPIPGVPTGDNAGNGEGAANNADGYTGASGGGYANVGGAGGGGYSNVGGEGAGGYPGAGGEGAGGYPGAGGEVTTGGFSGAAGATGATGGAGVDSGIVDSGIAGNDAGTRPVTSPGVPYGDWMYYEVQGAICRDGSPAGYYLRPGTSRNLLIFLNGGGVCYDDFFCAINPANVNQSLPGETLMDATIDTFLGAIAPARQIPPEEGILKIDPRNPVGEWNMVYVPYCTGDVYAGTTPNSPVVTAPMLPPQNFMGYANLGLFYQSFGPDYMDSAQVLLAGSSAGGFGALLNFDRTQEFFYNSEVLAVTDSGIPFRDQYLEPCLQATWRQLWGIDKILPPNCTGCFNPDGGGLTELSRYIADVKYPGRVLGGGISSTQDEVMKLFYSAGLYDCTMPALLAMASYPADRYPLGLQDFVQNVMGGDRAGSYITDGITHQHIFRPRYYEDNGLGMTIAEWVAELLAGNAVHAGNLF